MADTTAPPEGRKCPGRKLGVQKGWELLKQGGCEEMMVNSKRLHEKFQKSRGWGQKKQSQEVLSDSEKGG